MKDVQPGDTVAVWFSCGAVSAVAAKLTLDLYGDTARVRIVNNPIAEEHPDNRRFLRDVGEWLGAPIEIATNSKYPAASAHEVWEARRFMAGPQGAVCTTQLKKAARLQWESLHNPDWHVLGFTADERRRAERFMKFERNNVLPVLLDAGMTKADCMRQLVAAGVNPPLVYKLGYPNANCLGCVKATSPTYWNHVRRVNPEVFEQRAALSRELGVRLVRVRGERVFLDELGPEEVGRPMASMDFECGIFCEEIA